MKTFIITSIGAIALLTLLTGCNDTSNQQIVESQAVTTLTSIPTTTPTPSLAPVPALTPTPSHTPASKEESMQALIPAGWHILEPFQGGRAIAEGDLNKDGIADVAAVIEKNTGKDEASPRSLLIAFGGNNNTYTLSIIADHVILQADEGGVWGDPFENIIIDRGAVLVSDYGGSNWRWYNKYRFRYQDQDWYLIGSTSGTYFTGAVTMEQADEDDINYLTGQFIKRKTDEQGQTTTTKGNQGKKKLIKLKEFNSEDVQ
ncbi:hypothetical protein NSU18_13470 [Paenibacillus sp. FSL H8-0048]|uniref:hypothetical protein n=1 Tax=Paenibacillus sp. FSL H8-0048 TaxID=2954508 RepID=UPI0030F9CDAD